MNDKFHNKKYHVDNLDIDIDNDGDIIGIIQTGCLHIGIGIEHGEDGDGDGDVDGVVIGIGVVE